MRRFFTRWLAVLLLLLVFNPIIAFAQDGDPPEDGCDIYDGCPVPLDTWVLILVGAAVVYGFGKLNIQHRASPAKIEKHATPQHSKRAQNQLSIS